MLLLVPTGLMYILSNRVNGRVRLCSTLLQHQSSRPSLVQAPPSEADVQGCPPSICPLTCHLIVPLCFLTRPSAQPCMQ